jgi:hypothetical protein
VKTFETNPAPGASRQLEYIAPRETWEARCEAVHKEFAAAGHMIKVHPGELKKAWVACCSIVDKAMKTHSGVRLLCMDRVGASVSLMETLAACAAGPCRSPLGCVAIKGCATCCE